MFWVEQLLGRRPADGGDGPFNAASGADVVTSGDVTFTSTGFLATDPGAP